VIPLVVTPFAFLVPSFVTSVTVTMIRNALSAGIRWPRATFDVNGTRGVVSTQI
jgi:hypothetical protein